MSCRKTRNGRLNYNDSRRYELAASIILAEIGTDMTQFKNEHSLSAWAGISQGTTKVRVKNIKGPDPGMVCYKPSFVNVHG